jgi:hypothetical protein
MVLSMATGAKHPIDRKMRWNFGDSRGTSLSLDGVFGSEGGCRRRILRWKRAVASPQTQLANLLQGLH